VPQHNWDDEENIKSITEGDLADCVGDSDDDEDGSHAELMKGSGNASPAAKSANVSMEEADIAEAL